MENSEKLKNSKEVIAYLAERFPECFISNGEAKPLKIGIFQDLAERMAEDPKVSKTLLRTALRQYTSSWRYLHGLKAGMSRVDLDGNPCGELTQEHIDHARQALKDSKEKVFGPRKEKPAAKKPRPRVKKVDPAKLAVEQNVKVLLGKSPVPATIKEVTRDDVQVELKTGMSVRVTFDHIVL